MRDHPKGLSRRNRGVTLVEITVAILILCVGLLAFAQTAIVALRLATQGHAQWRAVTLARARLELLRSLGCAALPGTEEADGILLRWTIDNSGNGEWHSRRAVVQVVQDGRSGAHPDTFVGDVPCEP